MGEEQQAKQALLALVCSNRYKPLDTPVPSPKSGPRAPGAPPPADEDFYKIGYDVVSRRVGSRAFAISGVLDVVAKIDDAPSPSAIVTIVIGVRERARFDTSRVNVTLTPGSL